jgi:hypothetical protein
MIDELTGKVIGWVDQVVSFGNRYSDLLIYGIIAMMIAKMAKFKIKIGK